ncbi:glycosyltransferase family 2 protein [Picrophilus oshimae]|uniref:Glycosyltransferase involved in cell wall bisynthesis n=1 Tax=Picrophilus torridus (strain ATCC 700027 / DSM 9790 / JCM 10055 / NBRC 100828 / KAW 2/3) TaxID=1122961 RepID=A0A8G2FWJ2_PICTO|nr:glycosyltransferase family 2 protein [Picrophilus oshimae]SMD30787.1 Glycosyltransferase involved in cell wall bisynthesis [Picrophilus oshimae DSM 9789]
MPSIFITVIIPSYRPNDFVYRAIKSALNQTLSAEFYEVIVVLNYTDEKISSMARENKIKVLYVDQISLSPKYIEAIKISMGNVICFLDYDDLFYPEKLEYIYNEFKNNKNLVYLHNRCTFIDDNDKPVNEGYNSPDFNLSSISIKKDIINIDYLSRVTALYDTFFYYISLDSAGEIKLTRKFLTYYRFHESTSNTLSEGIERWKNKMAIYMKYLNSLESMYSFLKSKKSRVLARDYIISLKIELNMLHDLLNSGKRYELNYDDILFWLAVPSYKANKLHYPFKFIKIIQYGMPVKYNKRIENYLLKI